MHGVVGMNGRHAHQPPRRVLHFANSGQPSQGCELAACSGPCPVPARQASRLRPPPPPPSRHTRPEHPAEGGGRPGLRCRGLHFDLPSRGAAVRHRPCPIDCLIAGCIPMVYCIPALVFVLPATPDALPSLVAAPGDAADPGSHCSTQVAVTQGAAGASYRSIVRDMIAGGLACIAAGHCSRSATALRSDCFCAQQQS